MAFAPGFYRHGLLLLARTTKAFLPPPNRIGVSEAFACWLLAMTRSRVAPPPLRLYQAPRRLSQPAPNGGLSTFNHCRILPPRTRLHPFSLLNRPPLTRGLPPVPTTRFLCFQGRWPIGPCPSTLTGRVCPKRPRQPPALRTCNCVPTFRYRSRFKGCPQNLAGRVCPMRSRQPPALRTCSCFPTFRYRSRFKGYSQAPAG